TSNWSQLTAEELIAASTRRLVVLRGPIATAIHLQRLTDLCAAKHVLPIEHWRALAQAPSREDDEAELEEKAAAEARPRRRWFKNPAIAYLIGFGLCFVVTRFFR